LHAIVIMPSVIDLYERLSTAPDDKTRAKIIAEAFEALEERYPHLGDMATRQDLRETELRLLKEIEQVRANLRVEIEQVRVEIEQVRADLSKEIEQVRADLSKEVEQVRAELGKEIEKIRAELKVEIAKLRVELKNDIGQAQLTWLKWSFLFWISQLGAILLLLWRLWPK